jgi:hypothetical protein
MCLSVSASHIRRPFQCPEPDSLQTFPNSTRQIRTRVSGRKHLNSRLTSPLEIRWRLSINHYTRRTHDVADGVQPRSMYESGLNYQVWVEPQHLTGNVRYRMTSAQLYPNEPGAPV